MAPSVIPDLWSGFWGDHLYYTLINLDPTLLPGATIYRWPEVLGAHSKGHDAAVAVIKGAMKIINDQETITGPKLAEMIRTVGFNKPSYYSLLFISYNHCAILGELHRRNGLCIF